MNMRMKLPLIRSLAVPPARAPILRYGVALLSTVLALIPTLFFSDIAESRLVVFAVAVMVSAWYGGWKPGLAATSFALTVSAYYSFGRDLGSLYSDAQQWFQTADYFHARKEFNNLTTECVRKDGGAIVARISGRSIPNGKEGGSFELFMEDITETRVLELQLRQAQKMEAIGRLAGGIAHDFNNLLMVISGYSEFLLERVGPDPRLRGPAQEISNATQRATSLTRQLLAFSRKQMLAPKVLDLNEVVAENLKMLTRMIGEDIDLVMVPGPAIGAVRADPGQIDQVIMNLAVNARDAMPQGGKLTIETANVTLDENFARTHTPLTAGDYIMLAISDTGIGMDNETQSRIFEPFFTTKGAKGTGLGLSTVYGIVKQSGGYIFVDSQPHRGTTFRTYFPRVDGREDAAAAQDSLALPRADRGQETILLVEDENNLRRLARQYLETQGYKILEAEDGAAALQIVAGHKGPIDLLLTDVVMPGMNGRELALHITAERSAIRVLYMSGYTENAIGHNGMLYAGINLLQKPFSLPALKDKVREVLDSEPTPLEAVMPSRSTAAVLTGKKIPPFRARRFNLHLPLRYRLLGEQRWLQGTTENISRSGLLFQAEEMLQPNAQLEINLVLPAEIAGLAATEVVCRGEVVRTIGTPGKGVSPALAAKILQYRFQHGSHMPQA